MIFSGSKKSSDQRGIASLIVVGILALLLTLISIGFSVIMSRSLQDSLADQQEAAADDAAQSAINVIASYLQAHVLPDLSDLSTKVPTPQCDSILKPGPNQVLKPDLASTAIGDTRITCAQVSRGGAVTQNAYDLKPYQSKVVELQLSNGNSIAAIVLSWSGGSGQKAPYNLNPTLPDESFWACPTGNPCSAYVPVLRAEFDQVPSSGALDSFKKDNFFFYPESGGGTNTTDIKNDRPPAKGGSSQSLFPLDCDLPQIAVPLTPPVLVPRNGDCGVAVYGLELDAKKVYLRLMPIYSSAVVTVTAYDQSGNATNLTNEQAVIDVTARSGTAVKRLQAYVSLNGGKVIPDFAIRSSNALCKRVVWQSGVIDTIVDPDADCFDLND